MSARSNLAFGLQCPYDGTTRDVKDWAHCAALGVLSDLCGRRGVKWELQHIDGKTRREIVDSLTAIIREAQEFWDEGQPTAPIIGG